MGWDKVAQYTDKQLIDIPSKTFNHVKKQDWFSDEFVKEIIRQIDRAEVSLRYTVKLLDYNSM